MVRDYNGTMIGLNRVWSTEFMQNMTKDYPTLHKVEWTKLNGFSEDTLEDLSDECGLYAFVWKNFNKLLPTPVSGTNVVYIGQGINLKHRLSNYISYINNGYSNENRRKILFMLDECKGDIDIYIAKLQSQHLDPIEAILIKLFDPYFNTQCRLGLDFKVDPVEVSKKAINASTRDAEDVLGELA